MTTSTPTIARAARNASTDSPSNGSVVDMRSLDTPIGTLLLERNEDGLSAVRFGGSPARSSDPLLAEAARQLEAYFAGRLTEFDIPLAPRGTEFQLSVWRAVSAIPYGRTASYSEIAAKVCSVRACRAVGAAGALTGYGGGLERKRALLDLEAAEG